MERVRTLARQIRETEDVGRISDDEELGPKMSASMQDEIGSKRERDSKTLRKRALSPLFPSLSVSLSSPPPLRPNTNSPAFPSPHPTAASAPPAAG